MAVKYYTSTRDNNVKIDASDAIIRGISKDGGLFVPASFEKIDKDFKLLTYLNYQDLSNYILSKYLDFSEDELKFCINNAYNMQKFDDENIVALKECDNFYFLELFHGNTIAFKDMALSILPYFMTICANKKNISQKILILTATSGDTGKAAMSGFSDVDGTYVIVFYPKDKVSYIQELQMVTQIGKNVKVVAVKGNFDDAQMGVKKVLSDNFIKDKLLDKNLILSSANSINIGRLLPQIIYYIYSYLQLLKNNKIKDNEKINIVVPTGNFGNILAAYYAKNMGLPVNKLICASNMNNVLTGFFNNGIYDKNREFYTTISPSMDILVSSNLERLLYHLSDNDDSYVKNCMDSLNNFGKYEINDKLKSNLNDFYAAYATEEETKSEIKRIYSKYNYVIDTHTAVASAIYQKYLKDTNDVSKTVIASTASCYKFLSSIYPCLYPDEDISLLNDFELADKLSNKIGVKVPATITKLKTAKILHTTTIEKNEISDIVLNI